jgi:endonuclease/exonuclease/phosphatase family metal-dependent hydrolase
VIVVKKYIVWILVLVVLLSSIFVLASCSCSSSEPLEEWKERDDDDLLIMSYNIRYDTWLDTFKKDWDNRKSGLTEQIANINPDIIGMQEVTKKQFDYIEERFSNQYDYIVTYRDGEEEGEASPIFYNKDRFDLIDSGTFWLSETPDVVSIGWDAKLNRICTYAKLYDKTKGENLVFFNTHLDNKGEIARSESINLISAKIIEMDTPAILIGDFNFSEEDDAYNLAINNFDNAKYVATETMDQYTYNGFGDGELLIDHCFITRNDFVVNKYEVITEKNGDAFYSDHYPLLISLDFE